MANPSILNHRVTQLCYAKYLELTKEGVKFEFNDLIKYVNYKLLDRKQVLFAELNSLLQNTKPKNVYDFLWFESIK